jgi:hypothetical protein
MEPQWWEPVWELARITSIPSLDSPQLPPTEPHLLKTPLLPNPTAFGITLPTLEPLERSTQIISKSEHGGKAFILCDWLIFVLFLIN